MACDCRFEDGPLLAPLRCGATSRLSSRLSSLVKHCRRACAHATPDRSRAVRRSAPSSERLIANVTSWLALRYRHNRPLQNWKWRCVLVVVQHDVECTTDVLPLEFHIHREHTRELGLAL